MAICLSSILYNAHCRKGEITNYTHEFINKRKQTFDTFIEQISIDDLLLE